MATEPEQGGGQRKPVLLAVDDNEQALGMLSRELGQRYGVDYEVICERSPRRALALGDRPRAPRRWPSCSPTRRWASWPGAELLERVRRMHPSAKRGLLVHWGDWAHPERARGMVGGMAAAQFDYYVLKPARPGEEQFHRLISEFLYEWAQLRSPAESEITLVGGEWSPRTHELRSLLARNGVPHAFVDDDCERGRRLLARGRLHARRGPDRDRPRRADAGQPDQDRARDGVRRQHRARRRSATST